MGDPMAEARALEAELAANPGDAAVRAKVVARLGELTAEVRSVTRDQVLVMTSAKQREFCAYAADRMITLGGGDATALALKEEVKAGEDWVWRSRNLAALLGGFAVAAGLAVVVFAALAGSVALVAAAAVVSSAALAAIVLTYRRQRWRLDAERVSQVVWRHGI
ncbi:hypothetical protein SAMN05421504_103943 [Amycolatopsis xylanica]|uniref:Uncharacterized protein n=2 Tax=Amycolatopsis xylanica TaxID=589385 RepID=A0A1H3ERQ5_9PSEU|nr:hypothetical protein SAMN05421504_103943 [Amycolatopsis xylanica]